MAGESNSAIQKMLGTGAAVAQPEPNMPDASMPTIQDIATNGKLLVENLSQLAKIVEGWSS